MIRTFILFLTAIGIALLLKSCATVSSPTGGPRDETPPRLESSSIPNGSVNFEGKTITMTFNEYVKLNNPTQNIYSSPPLGNSVGFVTRKNKLFVTFKDSLESNTTYHLNFGNSIQDVNEGNPISNFQFFFATGAYIDSLSIQGKLEPVNDIKITPNTLVGLYKDVSDSVFLKKAPFYFTFVEDDGSFSLNYLKAGTYQVTALTDANNNYYYDLPNEAIGFADTLFDFGSDTSGITLSLFLPEDPEIRIQSFTNTVSSYKIEYELSQALPFGAKFNTYLISDSLEIESLNQVSEDRTKITSWLDLDFAELNSFQSVLNIQGSVLDTFQHSISKNKKPIPSLSVNGSEFTKNDSIIFTSSSPMVRVCENIALIDTLKGDTIGLNAIQLFDYQIVVKIPSAAAEEIVYTLLMPDSCLSSIWDQYYPKKSEIVKIISNEERGTLIFNFEGMSDGIDYIVSLVNEKSERVKSITISSELKTWNLHNLSPGNYMLKITEDENRNGVWNSGSYNPKRYPEKIYEYPKEFTVRPNWELEESVNLKNP